jgi:hypothetical protein
MQVILADIASGCMAFEPLELPRELRRLSKNTLRLACGDLNRASTIELPQGCKRKPFGVLAEGFVLNNGRGDRTAFELFIAGVWGWDAGFRERIENGSSVNQ